MNEETLAKHQATYAELAAKSNRVATPVALGLAGQIGNGVTNVLDRLATLEMRIDGMIKAMDEYYQRTQHRFEVLYNALGLPMP